MRDAYVDNVKDIKVKEKENMCLLHMKVFTSQIQSRSLLKPHWCVRPRLGDALLALITIFACSPFHNKIEH